MTAQSDRERFDRLLRPQLPRLFRLACRLTASRVDADDLFQELLTRVYLRLDELEALADPASWLARVMYNLFIDDRRRYARERLRVLSEAELDGHGIDALGDGRDGLQDVVRRERLQLLDRALAELSEDHRLAILLHDVEGYKIVEIQEITGDPAGTVKSRLHRGRARLRELLQEHGTFS